MERSRAGRNHYLARQVLVDLRGCPFERLNDPQLLRAVLFGAAGLMGTSVLQYTFHQFEPQGVTAVAIVSASHLSIHTWPEHGVATLDAMSCDSGLDITELVAFLEEQLGGVAGNVVEMSRGPAADRQGVGPIR